MMLVHIIQIDSIEPKKTSFASLSPRTFYTNWKICILFPFFYFTLNHKKDGSYDEKAMNEYVKYKL